jgi:hypothetical protein
MQSRKEITNQPFYLLFLAIYPSISLMALNIREVDSSVVYRPMFASLILSLFVYLLHLTITRDRGHAIIQSAVLLVLFFNYGHFSTYIAKFELANQLGVKIHIPLLIVSLLIYLLGRYHREFFVRQTKAINVMSLVLMMIPLFQIGQYIVSTRSNTLPDTTDNSVILQADTPPDIYYIILDAYNRADNLLLLGYDNSQFINALREMDFFVADCSQTNYQRTALSLASSLNMDYLFNAIPNDGHKDDNSQPVYNAIKNNRVRKELENLGYKIIAFQSGYRWGEWRNADIYFKPDSNLLFVRYLTPFENLFLESTVLKTALDFNWLPFLNDTYAQYGEHYERVHFVLETLPDMASLPGPKFVYAHMIVPHSPYIFLPDGSVNQKANLLEWTDEEGYINNVKFINSALEPIIREIIQESENPPVIVIQADHGTAFLADRRYFILNAYHLPEKDIEEIPSTITPVNTFRMIFNLYFGTDYPYREDISFTTDIGRPYKETVVEFPENISQCGSPTTP